MRLVDPGFFFVEEKAELAPATVGHFVVCVPRTPLV